MIQKLLTKLIKCVPAVSLCNLKGTQSELCCKNAKIIDHVYLTYPGFGEKQNKTACIILLFNFTVKSIQRVLAAEKSCSWSSNTHFTFLLYRNLFSLKQYLIINYNIKCISIFEQIYYIESVV